MCFFSFPVLLVHTGNNEMLYFKNNRSLFSEACDVFNKKDTVEVFVLYHPDLTNLCILPFLKYVYELSVLFTFAKCQTASCS
jgi:hypothetical protein